MSSPRAENRKWLESSEKVGCEILTRTKGPNAEGNPREGKGSSRLGPKRKY